MQPCSESLIIALRGKAPTTEIFCSGGDREAQCRNRIKGLDSAPVLLLVQRLNLGTAAGLKSERDAIHAVALPSGLGAVGEDMAQVAATVAAVNFCTHHK